MSYQHNEFPIILERFAMNYPRQSRFGYELLPLYEADITKDFYKVAQFDADHLIVEDFKRAYGEEALRTQLLLSDWLSVPVSRYTVESSVDRAELVGSSDLMHSSLLVRETRMRNAYDKLMKSIEISQVESILDHTQYGDNTVVPANLWSDESTDVLAQIETARQQVKNSIGYYPNKCVISDTVWQVLRYREGLVDRLPSTTLQAGLTPDDFAKIIAVDKVIIADDMRYIDGKLEYVWGDNVVLAYTPEHLHNLEELSFGVTIRTPLGIDSMRDYFDERTTSDVTAIDEKLGWAVTNYKAGFLFRNVL